MNMIIWLVIATVLIIVEASTLNLVTIWFAIGSGAAYLMAIAGMSFWAQFAAFAVVSLILLIFTRPLASKYVNEHFVKTNVDSLIGQTAKIISEIDNKKGFGAAIVNGMEWTAVSSDDSVIFQEGDRAVITDVSGVKLILSREVETLDTPMKFN